MLFLLLTFPVDIKWCLNRWAIYPVGEHHRRTKDVVYSFSIIIESFPGSGEKRCVSIGNLSVGGEDIMAMFVIRVEPPITDCEYSTSGLLIEFSALDIGSN